MYVVTWSDNGRSLWEKVANKAAAIAYAARKGGRWVYVA